MSNVGRYDTQINNNTESYKRQECMCYSRDKIKLQAMQFYGYHGVLAAEKMLGQVFVVHLEMQLDLQRAGNSDDLKLTVNYADVYEVVKVVVEQKRYDLIETLAEQIAQEVIKQQKLVDAVTVKIEKPQAPIAGVFEYAGIEITRTRATVIQEKTCFLGLGSNIGDKKNYIHQAIQKIAELEQVIYLQAAHIYESKPHGVTGQDNYYNTVISIRTEMRPDILLKKLQIIEKKFGRVRSEQWAPRTIDIDILACEDLLIVTPDLTVPHPRLHEREFVLAPLIELTEDWRHPFLSKNVYEMYADVQKFGVKKLCRV